MKNQKKNIRNTSGFVGVYWDKNARKWQARVTVNGKNFGLGYYNDFNKAVFVRKLANKNYNFSSNHGI